MTSEILCLHKFELAMKGILITSVVQLLRKKQVIYEPDYS
jgi:hypothetical protein